MLSRVYCWRNNIWYKMAGILGRSKADSFERTDDGKFLCLVCNKKLSSKRNVLLHLVDLHGASPMKKVRKLYEENDSHLMPKSTFYYRRCQERNDMKQKQGAQPNSCLNKDLPSEKEMYGSRNSSSESINDDAQINCDCNTDYENIGGVVSDPLGVSHELDEQSLDSFSSNASSTTNLSDDSPDSSDSDDNSTYIDSSESDDDFYQVKSENVLIPDHHSSKEELKILSCFIRNTLTVSACKDILQTFKEVTADSLVWTRLSYNKIWNIVESKTKEYHYCQQCEKLFPSNPELWSCSSCEGFRYVGDEADQRAHNRRPCKSFLFIEPGVYLKGMLELPGMWDLVMKGKLEATQRMQQAENDGSVTITDMTDGLVYRGLLKKGCFLNEKNNISVIMNSDGVGLYSSTNTQLWPIFLAIVELPPSVRFARENIIDLSLWQGKSKPPFKLYMEVFTKEMNSLYEKGFKLDVNGKELSVKVCLVTITADLPARAEVMNMSYFNGAFACVRCEHPGEKATQGKGHVKTYLFNADCNSRTDSTIRECMENGTSNNRCKGFKGKSGLFELKGIDLCKICPPEYMHCITMGIVPRINKRWFSVSDRKSPYFIGDKLKEISQKMKQIKPPDSIERLPRDLEKHYLHFKATENQVWLLYYAIPCLENILPIEYLEHYTKLSSAVHILLGDCISEEELLQAQQSLQSFYTEYPTLYPEGDCGLNFHSLGAHLIGWVKDLGPLWAWSCFPFEDANASILKICHGTGIVTNQILRYKAAELLVRKEERGIISNNSESVVKSHGKLKPLEGQSDRELTYLMPGKSLENAMVAARISINGQMYYSEGYRRMKRRTCNCVELADEKIGLVQKFIVKTDGKGEIYAVTKMLKIDSTLSKHDRLEASQSNEVKIYSANQIKEKLILVDCQSEKLYVSRLPNKIGRSVFK